MKKNLIRIVIRALGVPVLKLWFLSLRFDNKLIGRSPRILGFWHQDIFCALAFLTLELEQHSIVAIVSASSDGDILKTILNRLGISVVQGSSSKSGFEVALKAVLTDHEFILITPDGPKGPPMVMKDGIYGISRMRNVPISFLTFDCSCYKQLSSWDHFVIPWPFSKCRVTETEKVASGLHDH